MSGSANPENRCAQTSRRRAVSGRLAALEPWGRATREGKRMLEAGQPLTAEVLASSFGALSDPERQSLLDLLTSVATDL